MWVHNMYVRLTEKKNHPKIFIKAPTKGISIHCMFFSNFCDFPFASEYYKNIPKMGSTLKGKNLLL